MDAPTWVARSGLMSSLSKPSPIWTVIVPVKQTTIAKSRLTRLSSADRGQLALAFALDTVTAALSCPWVRRVVVVTSDPAAGAFTEAGAVVLRDEPEAGLNAALTYAASAIRRSTADACLAAVSGDLPAVDPQSFSCVFAAASAPRWFVADISGSGTTLLAANGLSPLLPAFGPNSRARHQSGGARESSQPGLDRLRRDVDTEGDLLEAVRLGVGHHTSAALGAIGWEPVR
ncbi:MAG: 2-phospho-L-lactate guanylyltransferase [Nocardioidaceae bacterium]